MWTKETIDEIIETLKCKGYSIIRVDDENEVIVLVVDPMSPAISASRRFPLKSSGQATLVVEKGKNHDV